jgi:hypothetical protein
MEWNGMECVLNQKLIFMIGIVEKVQRIKYKWSRVFFQKRIRLKWPKLYLIEFFISRRIGMQCISKAKRRLHANMLKYTRL